MTRFLLIASVAGASIAIDPALLGLVLVLLVGSAFYSGSETALVSARRARLEYLASEGRRDAKTALALLEDPAKSIAVTLVGTNICNIGATSLATAIALAFSAEHGPALATLVLTPVTLFGAEILPKAFFRSRANTALLLSAGVLRVSEFVFAPVVALTSGVTKVLFRLLPGGDKRPVFGRRDLENLFLFGRVREESDEKREDAETTLRMAGKALDLKQRPVTEALVPITPEQTCRASDSLADARERFRHARSNHLVIVDENDQVAGFVAAKTLLGEPTDKLLESFVRPAYVLDADDSLDEVMQGLRRHQQPIGLIRGSEGETLGIITPEDVLEEIVGELRGVPPGRAEG